MKKIIIGVLISLGLISCLYGAYRASTYQNYSEAVVKIGSEYEIFKINSYKLYRGMIKIETENGSFILGDTENITLIEKKSSEN